MIVSNSDTICPCSSISTPINAPDGCEPMGVNDVIGFVNDVELGMLCVDVAEDLSKEL